MASWDKMTKYTHKSSDEFDSYEEALTGVLRLHKDKLDPFLKGTDMNTLTKARLEAGYNRELGTDGKSLYTKAQVKQMMQVTRSLAGRCADAPPGDLPLVYTSAPLAATCAGSRIVMSMV